MYHHKHHAARVAVMNYPAGQDRLIRSWFGGRTRLVNNDKWRHAPSYIILRFCLKLGKPFIFLKFSNLYIFPSGGASLPSALICNESLLHNSHSCTRRGLRCRSAQPQLAQLWVQFRSKAHWWEICSDSFLIHFTQVDYLRMSTSSLFSGASQLARHFEGLKDLI